VNWLLQNLWPRFRFSLNNLRYATVSLFREFTLADERFLSSITGVSPKRICSFINEPFNTRAFAACLCSVPSSKNHHSLHWYDHMLWEFRSAYPRLHTGVLLISDDAGWNPVFSEFIWEVAAIKASELCVA